MRGLANTSRIVIMYSSDWHFANLQYHRVNNFLQQSLGRAEQHCVLAWEIVDKQICRSDRYFLISTFSAKMAIPMGPCVPVCSE
jgi:hypothetical protein